MAGTALDTSVIIAGLLKWHEFHSRARPALESALESEDSVILPVHALVEAYSVLTRLPPPRRLSPEQASAMLTESLREDVRLVGVVEETWSVIEELAERALGGGLAYDAVILASARKAGATRILTLNGRHFRRLADEGLEVWEPEEPASEKPRSEEPASE